MSFSRRHRNNKGLTLIEVLIAVSIFSSIYVILMSSMKSNYQKVRSTRIKTTMTNLLERKMLEIESLYKHNFDGLPEEQEGEFEGMPEYRWSLESQNMEFPDLSSIILSQEDTIDETTKLLVGKMKDYFSETVKEVSVTVSYQKKGMKKPYRYTLSTLFVSFDKQVGL